MCCGMIQVWYKCHGYSTWLSLMCWGEATVDCFVGVSLGIALWCAAVSQSAHHISSTVLLCYHHFSVFHQSFDRLSPCVLRGLVKAELPHACAFHHAWRLRINMCLNHMSMSLSPWPTPGEFSEGSPMTRFQNYIFTMREMGDFHLVAVQPS